MCPTVAETVPGFEYVAWNGYAVTGGVPAEVADPPREALQVIARDPEIIKIFANLGIEFGRHDARGSRREHPQGHADLCGDGRHGGGTAQITIT